MPLTHELGRFVASLTFERLPAEAVEIARTGIIDTVATMIAGAHDPAPQLLRRALTPPRQARPASISRARPRPRPRRHGSTAPPGTRSITTMSAAAAMSRPYCCRRSSPRPKRWTVAAARCSPPMSPATRPGPSWPAATPAITTSRAGTRPASSARSARRGVRHAAPPLARAGDDGDRAGGVAGGRHHGQFRHDDEAVPRRARGACRGRLGAPRWPRLHRRRRRARTPAGLSLGGLARGQGGPRGSGAARSARSGRSSGKGSASRNTRPVTAPTAPSTACSTCSPNAR